MLQKNSTSHTVFFTCQIPHPILKCNISLRANINIFINDMMTNMREPYKASLVVRQKIMFDDFNLYPLIFFFLIKIQQKKVNLF